MPTAKLKSKAKGMKTKETQAPPLEASRKRPASSTPPAEAHSASLARAKKMKADLEQGKEDSTEEARFAKPVESTTEDREKRIKELEELVGDLQATVSTLTLDKMYMNGAYEYWPQLFIGDWPKRLRRLMYDCHDWSCEYGIENQTGKYKHLSKEQKKQLIADMKGYVFQDDFDKIVPQLPPNIRCRILAYFAGIVVVKEIFDLFFTNPSNKSEESGVETPFGAQLNHTTNSSKLARHWRAKTTRLSNSTTLLHSHNPAFGLKNVAVRKAKVKQVVAARLADKSFQWLLKDIEDEYQLENREVNLIHVYKSGAELAMLIATSQPELVWRTLEDIQPLFYRTSKEIEAAHMHGLHERESRLNGHRVLAVTRPSFWRTGGWNRDGKGRIIEKSSVSHRGPHREERKQRKAQRAAKKANDEKAGKEKPPPKAKAKKATKKKN
ncbi:hypothetical protein BDW42DRAFT_183242 [Aspergillus taichungensis]|uniref:Uncharacterized protein n=1 Tax=Aspergillus taichungensis TaxID=482145 RepID=A0A2J5I5C2_9EURO|nr:hypothetical protein BDW42DRAFT_183242 [Aspergillus taichungensis]